MELYLNILQQASTYNKISTRDWLIIILSFVAFIILVICICLYLKACQKKKYNPMNVNIVFATLSVPLTIGGLLFIIDSGAIQSDFHALIWIGPVICWGLALSSILINIIRTYRCCHSLAFSIMNFIIQLWIGVVVAFTMGLILVLLLWGTQAILRDRDD